MFSLSMAMTGCPRKPWPISWRWLKTMALMWPSRDSVPADQASGGKDLCLARPYSRSLRPQRGASPLLERDTLHQCFQRSLQERFSKRLWHSVPKEVPLRRRQGVHYKVALPCPECRLHSGTPGRLCPAPGADDQQSWHRCQKYAHALGVYLRLKKYFENREEGKSILNLIDTFELPNALLKMVTEIAKANDLAKFQKVINSEFVRSTLRPGYRSILFKPEVAFKAWEALNLPEALFNSYRKKGREL